MDRMTLSTPDGEVVPAPGCAQRDLLHRLKQYEDLHQSLLDQLAQANQRLDDLRAQGRIKSVTYRQFLAQRLTLKDLLARIDLYVR